MIKTLIMSQKIDSAVSSNSVIYILKNMGFLNKIIPKNLYSNTTLKIVAKTILDVLKFLIMFIVKGILIGICIIPFINKFFPTDVALQKNAFFIIFILMGWVFSGITASKMFESKMKNYYCIYQMKMNPKKYAISRFVFYLLIDFIHNFPALVIIGSMYSVSIIECLALNVGLSLFRIIGEAIHLIYMNKTGKKLDENAKYLLGMLAITAISAYVISYNKIIIHFNILWLLPVLVVSLLCLIYLLKNNGYREIMLKTQSLKKVMFDFSDQSVKEQMYGIKIKKEDIALNSEISNKHGYDFLNDIFFRRHRSIMQKPVTIMNYIIIGFSIIAFIVLFTIPESSKIINEILTNKLPNIVFIIYMLNRGELACRAFFFNCDNSLLTYSFYRKEDVILSNFKRRLKTIIKLNMQPGILMAITFTILLYLTGGSGNILTYITLPVSVVCITVFFSIYYLSMYYLFQPYSMEMKMKSGMYNIINSLVYLLVFLLVGTNLNTNIFCIIIITITVIFTYIMKKVIQKQAPITFKIK